MNIKNVSVFLLSVLLIINMSLPTSLYASGDADGDADETVTEPAISTGSGVDTPQPTTPVRPRPRSSSNDVIDLSDSAPPASTLYDYQQAGDRGIYTVKLGATVTVSGNNNTRNIIRTEENGNDEPDDSGLININIDNVTMATPGHWDPNFGPIAVGTNSSVKLNVSGTNHFTTDQYGGLIQIWGDANISVEGEGTNSVIDLESINKRGAGIGGGYSSSQANYIAGNITIKNVAVTANLTGNGACIGGGYGVRVKSITIEDSVITASAYSGSCIGGGRESASCGSITIKNSSLSLSASMGSCIGGGNGNSKVYSIDIYSSTIIQANNGGNGAFIGEGFNGCEVQDITIHSGYIKGGTGAWGIISENPTRILGGTININNINNGDSAGTKPRPVGEATTPVYKHIITLSRRNTKITNIAIENAPYYDVSGVKTDENGKLYFYLPQSSGMTITTNITGFTYTTDSAVVAVTPRISSGYDEPCSTSFLGRTTSSLSTGDVIDLSEWDPDAEGKDASNNVLWTFDQATSIYTVKLGAEVKVIGSNENTGARVVTEEDGNDEPDNTGVIKMTIEGISATGGALENEAPILVGINTSVILSVTGNNYLVGNKSAGLQIATNASITVVGMTESSLKVQSLEKGAGIGGGTGINSGKIYLYNVSMVAIGLNGAAIGVGHKGGAIGGGDNCVSEDIVISESSIHIGGGTRGIACGNNRNITNSITIFKSDISVEETAGVSIGIGRTYRGDITISSSRVNFPTTSVGGGGAGIGDTQEGDIIIDSSTISSHLFGLGGTGIGIVNEGNIKIINSEIGILAQRSAIGRIYHGDIIISNSSVQVTGNVQSFYNSVAVIGAESGSSIGAIIIYDSDVGTNSRIYTGGDASPRDAVAIGAVSDGETGDITIIKSTYNRSGQGKQNISAGRNADIIIEDSDVTARHIGAFYWSMKDIHIYNSTVDLAVNREDAEMRPEDADIGGSGSMTFASIVISDSSIRTEALSGAGIGAGHSITDDAVSGDIDIIASTVVANSISGAAIGSALSSAKKSSVGAIRIYSGTIICRGSKKIEGESVVISGGSIKADSITPTPMNGENTEVTKYSIKIGARPNSKVEDVIISHAAYYDGTTGVWTDDECMVYYWYPENQTQTIIVTSGGVGWTTSGGIDNPNNIIVERSDDYSYGDTIVLSDIYPMLEGRDGGEATGALLWIFNPATSIYMVLVGASVRVIGSNENTGVRVVTQEDGNDEPDNTGVINMAIKNISATGGALENEAPILVRKNTSVVLSVTGNNYLVGNKSAGLQLAKDANIKITGIEGASLTAISLEKGAGIGTGVYVYERDGNAGKIEIEKVSIIASAQNGADIGKGVSADVGNVTIHSGMVTATPKGIEATSVEIFGGSINASSITPTPKNGAVNGNADVIKYTIKIGTIPNSKVEDVRISHATYYDGTTGVWTDDECKVYYWYPENQTQTIDVTSGGVGWTTSGGIDNPDGDIILERSDDCSYGDKIVLSDMDPMLEGRVGGVSTGALLWTFDPATSIYAVELGASVRVVRSNEKTGVRVVTKENGNSMTGDTGVINMAIKNISATGGALENEAPILVGTNTSVILSVTGNNYLVGKKSAGLQLAEQANIKITGIEGASLKATSLEKGAGIGTGVSSGNAGFIEIEKVSIIVSAQNGADIGNGVSADVGNVTIHSGMVTATPKGIEATSVEIFGGSINASSITPTPKNGAVNGNDEVIKYTIKIGTIPNSKVEDVRISPAAYYDGTTGVWTDDECKVYYWYPEDQTQTINVTSGGVGWTTSGGIDNPDEDIIVEQTDDSSYGDKIVLSDIDPMLEGRVGGEATGALLWTFDPATSIYAVKLGASVRVIRSNEKTGVRVVTEEDGNNMSGDTGAINMAIENISATGGALANEAPILVGRNTSVVLSVTGNNYLVGNKSAGLQLAGHANIKITGIEGALLKATSLEQGAGIGPGVYVYGIDFGNSKIEIEKVSIIASAQNGKDIGVEDDGNVTIRSGMVTATPNGIGAWDVEIYGGSIKADLISSATNGSEGGEPVIKHTIKIGTRPNTKVEDVRISPAAYYDGATGVWTDDECKVYYWYPEDQTQTIDVTSGGVGWTTSGAIDNPDEDIIVERTGDYSYGDTIVLSDMDPMLEGRDGGEATGALLWTFDPATSIYAVELGASVRVIRSNEKTGVRVVTEEDGNNMSGDTGAINMAIENISATGGALENEAPILVGTNTSVVLSVTGNNYLVGNKSAGLQLAEQANIKITGIEGALLKAISLEKGAGIGAGVSSGNAGKIEIEKVSIIAAAQNGADIGNGDSADVGNVTIHSGMVTATPKGIEATSVEIFGGSINASSITPTPKNGAVNGNDEVIKYTIKIGTRPNSKVEDVRISPAAYYDGTTGVWTDDECKVYYWYPEDQTQTIDVTSGGVGWTTSGGIDNPDEDIIVERSDDYSYGDTIVLSDIYPMLEGRVGGEATGALLWTFNTATSIYTVKLGASVRVIESNEKTGVRVVTEEDGNDEPDNTGVINMAIKNISATGGALENEAPILVGRNTSVVLSVTGNNYLVGNTSAGLQLAGHANIKITGIEGALLKATSLEQGAGIGPGVYVYGIDFGNSKIEIEKVSIIAAAQNGKDIGVIDDGNVTIRSGMVIATPNGIGAWDVEIYGGSIKADLISAATNGSEGGEPVIKHTIKIGTRPNTKVEDVRISPAAYYDGTTGVWTDDECKVYYWYPEDQTQTIDVTSGGVGWATSGGIDNPDEDIIVERTGDYSYGDTIVLSDMDPMLEGRVGGEATGALLWTFDPATSIYAVELGASVRVIESNEKTGVRVVTEEDGNNMSGDTGAINMAIENISATGGALENEAPILVGTNTSVVLSVTGNNYLVGKKSAGLQLAEQANIKITGIEGALLKAISLEKGAGIGTGVSSGNAGKIEIEKVSIIASAQNGADIGKGVSADVGNVTIHSGMVTAIPKGIEATSVEIFGGSINASSITPIPKNGAVNGNDEVIKYTIKIGTRPNSKVEDVSISPAAYYDGTTGVWTDDECKVYYWYPEDQTQTINVTFGGVGWTTSGAIDNPDEDIIVERSDDYSYGDTIVLSDIDPILEGRVGGEATGALLWTFNTATSIYTVELGASVRVIRSNEKTGVRVVTKEDGNDEPDDTGVINMAIENISATGGALEDEAPILVGTNTSVVLSVTGNNYLVGNKSAGLQLDEQANITITGIEGALLKATSLEQGAGIGPGVYVGGSDFGHCKIEIEKVSIIAAAQNGNDIGHGNGNVTIHSGMVTATPNGIAAWDVEIYGGSIKADSITSSVTNGSEGGLPVIKHTIKIGTRPNTKVEDVRISHATYYDGTTGVWTDDECKVYYWYPEDQTQTIDVTSGGVGWTTSGGIDNPDEDIILERSGDYSYGDTIVLSDIDPMLEGRDGGEATGALLWTFDPATSIYAVELGASVRVIRSNEKTGVRVVTKENGNNMSGDTGVIKMRIEGISATGGALKNEAPIIVATNSSLIITAVSDNCLTGLSSAGIQAAKGSFLTVTGINNSTIIAKSEKHGAGIGIGVLGTADDLAASATIHIYKIRLTASAVDGAGIGAGANGGQRINVTGIVIEDSTVSAIGQNAAGIGGGWVMGVGDITILNSSVNSISKDQGAGIGAAYESYCDRIVISASSIVAQALGPSPDMFGNDPVPYDNIGGVWFKPNSITIHSGMIVATTHGISAQNSVEIFGGSINAKQISPTPKNGAVNGNDEVIKHTIKIGTRPNTKVEDVRISPAAYYDGTTRVWTDDECKVYYWYPENQTQTIDVTSGGVGWTTSGAIDPDEDIIVERTDDYSYGDTIVLSDIYPMLEGRDGGEATGALLWTFDPATSIYTVKLGASVRVIRSNEKTGVRVVTEEDGNDEPDNTGVINMAIENISATGGALENEAPILVGTNTSVVLSVTGNNYLVGNKSAGLQLAEQANIKITGIEGALLKATSLEQGAGIGAGVSSGNAGKIEIEKVSIIVSAQNGADIGNGDSADVGNVTIHSGMVTATANGICAAGVEIFGGSINASSITPTPKNGAVNGNDEVIKYTIKIGTRPNSKVEDVSISPAAYYDGNTGVWTDDECKVYYWYPENQTQTIDVTSGGVGWTTSGGIDNPDEDIIVERTDDYSYGDTIVLSDIYPMLEGRAGGEATGALLWTFNPATSIYAVELGASVRVIGSNENTGVRVVTKENSNNIIKMTIEGISATGGALENEAPILVGRNTSVLLSVTGNNYLVGNKSAGLQLAEQANIKITGITDASLTAKSLEKGAGIGAGVSSGNAGFIEIEKVSIIAAAQNGADIGNGVSADVDYVTILSGMVTATPNGIEATYYVEIFGGSINAKRISPRPKNGSANGNKDVFKNTITFVGRPNTKVNSVSIPNAPYYDGTTGVWTDGDAKVYYWYPKTDGDGQHIDATSGGIDFTTDGAVTEDNDNNVITIESDGEKSCAETIVLSDKTPILEGRVGGEDSGALLWTFDPATSIYAVELGASVRVIESNENTGVRVVTKEDGNDEPDNTGVINMAIENISATGGALENEAPILVGRNTSVVLSVTGNNYLVGNKSAGLQLAEQANIKITGIEGALLKATSLEKGAGIGTGVSSGNAGKIEIEKVSIIAAAQNGADIGKGVSADVGNVTIHSGMVTATPKGIEATSVEILGGSIKADSITPRPKNGSANGNEDVFKNTITFVGRPNTKVNSVSIPNAPYYDGTTGVWTDGDAKVYYWYPTTDGDGQPIDATSGGIGFTTDGAVTEDNDDNVITIESDGEKSFAETIVLSDKDPILEGRAGGEATGALLWTFDPATSIYAVELGASVRVIESNENTGVRVVTKENGNNMSGDTGVIKMTIEGISATGGALKNEAPILVATNSSLIITAVSDNCLTGLSSAGIQAAKGSFLTVTGINNSTIIAKSETHGAGIGIGVLYIADYLGASATIHIYKIRLTASAVDGAGIGAGAGAQSWINVTGIVIEDSTVSAIGQNAAGIGGGRVMGVDDITILNSSVNSISKDEGAGIGAAYESHCDRIVISASSIVAQALGPSPDKWGNDPVPYDNIGGVWIKPKSITIHSGMIVATTHGISAENSVEIFGGSINAKRISPRPKNGSANGNKDVFKNTITFVGRPNTKVNSVSIPNAPYYDGTTGVWTDGDAKVYYWYPKTDGDGQHIDATSGGIDFTTDGAVTEDNDNNVITVESADEKSFAETIVLSDKNPILEGRVGGEATGALLWTFDPATSIYAVELGASVRVIESNEKTGVRVVTKENGNSALDNTGVINMAIENISATGGALENEAPILVGTNTSVVLSVTGNNYLVGNKSAGLQLAEQANITITGITDASLTAKSLENGAGIGGGHDMSLGGNIEIEKVSITAVAKNGAGIGAGNNAPISNIAISNANITAVSENGNDIGNGVVSNANILTINSGMVTAMHTGIAVTSVIILGGSIKADSITPRPKNGSANGNKDVFKNTITFEGRPNTKVNSVSIPNAPYYDGTTGVWTDGDAKVYYWYPITDEDGQPIDATSGGIVFTTDGAVTEGNDDNVITLESDDEKSFAETIVLSDQDPILEGRVGGEDSGSLLWTYDPVTKIYTVKLGASVRVIRSNESTGARVETEINGMLMGQNGFIKMTIEGISATGGALENKAPIIAGEKTLLIVTTVGENHLYGLTSAGIQVDTDGYLLILGTPGSSLYAKSYYSGAGIGGGYGDGSTGPAEGIRIESASVSAIANAGAGIGAGSNVGCKNVTISKSIISAFTNGIGCADIGQGFNASTQTVTIESGMVTAMHSGIVVTTGVDILGGSIKTNLITPRPKNGAVNGNQPVYKNTFTIIGRKNSKIDAFNIPNYSYYDAVSSVWTDNEAKVYYWYPVSSGQDLTATSRGIEYITNGAVTVDNDDNNYILTVSPNNKQTTSKIINLNTVFKNTYPNMGPHWSVDKVLRILYIDNKADVVVVGADTNITFDIDRDSIVNIELDEVFAKARDGNLFDIGSKTIANIRIVGTNELNVDDGSIFNVANTSRLVLTGGILGSILSNNAKAFVSGGKALEIDGMSIIFNTDSVDNMIDVYGELRITDSDLDFTNRNASNTVGVEADEIWVVRSVLDVKTNYSGIGGPRTSNVNIYASQINVSTFTDSLGYGIYAKDYVWIDSGNINIPNMTMVSIKAKTITILGGSINVNKLSQRAKNLENATLYRAICYFPVSNVKITGITIDGDYQYNYNGTMIDKLGRVFLYLPLHVYSTEIIFETEAGSFGGTVISNLGVENNLFNFYPLLSFGVKQNGGVRDTKDTTSLTIEFSNPVPVLTTSNVLLVNRVGKANITGVKMINDSQGKMSGTTWEVLVNNVSGGAVDVEIHNIPNYYVMGEQKSEEIELLSRIVLGFKLTQVGGKSKKKNTVSITITFTKPVTGLKSASVLIKNNTGKATKKSVSGKTTKYTIKLKKVLKEGYIIISLKEFGKYKYSMNNIKVKIFKKK